MKHLIAVVGDIHAGSTVGLHSDEETALDDGGYYGPSESQRWLWDNWQEYWAHVADQRKRKDKLHLIINGDAVDGDHHNTSQIVSRNSTVQFEVLKNVLKPALALKPDSIVVVRGTEVHVGGSGSTEEGLARYLSSQFNVVRDEATGTFSNWHFRGDYGGVRIDATHHGRMGTMPWTKAGVVGGLAAKIFMEHAMRGEQHPDIALRSHYHKFFDTHDQYPTRVVQLPAWQLSTGFGHRVSPEVLADIGGVVITAEDGEYTLDKRLYAPARPAVWSAE